MQQKFLTQGVVANTEYNLFESVIGHMFLDRIKSKPMYNGILNANFWFDTPIGCGGTSGSGVWALDGPERGKVIALHNMVLGHPVSIATAGESQKVNPDRVIGYGLLVESLKDKQKRLKKALHKVGGVTVNFDVPKWAYIQALLSLGDRRVGEVLLLVNQYEGDWKKAFRYWKRNPDFFVHRPRDLKENLPWDFIGHGIRKEHLITEYKLALKGRESDICRVGECTRCGVCQSGERYDY